MLLKSYPSLDLYWTTGSKLPEAFYSSFHAAATCRRWHPDAKILHISNYQEFLYINDFVKREIGSPTEEQRAWYRFMVRNNYHDDLITVVCDGKRTVRYRKAELGRHYSKGRSYDDKNGNPKKHGDKCSFLSFASGKCNGKFMSDMLLNPHKDSCTKARGLICEYTPDCPIDVRRKPHPVPRLAGLSFPLIFYVACTD